MKFFTSSDAIYGERDAGERERERIETAWTDSKYKQPTTKTEK